MMHRRFNVVSLLAVTLLAAACSSVPKSSGRYVRTAVRQRSEASRHYFNQWCDITITPMPTRAYTMLQAGDARPHVGSEPSPGGQRSWIFQIRIANRKTSAGPLKYCSRDLEHYQQQYAYLLNWAKGDFTLHCGDQTFYPSSYTYTTHYSAFPLEEMLVGFEELPANPKAPLTLCYIDRLFLHDTLQYEMNPIAIRREARQSLTPDFRP